MATQHDVLLNCFLLGVFYFFSYIVLQILYYLFMLYSYFYVYLILFLYPKN